MAFVLVLFIVLLVREVEVSVRLQMYLMKKPGSMPGSFGVHLDLLLNYHEGHIGPPNSNVMSGPAL